MLEIQCYQCVDARHMIHDYILIVLHKPQFALWEDLEFLVIPDQITALPYGLVGCCSHLL